MKKIKISNLVLVCGLTITVLFFFSQLTTSNEFATALIRLFKQSKIIFYSVLTLFVGIIINSFASNFLIKRKITNELETKMVAIFISFILLSVNYHFCNEATYPSLQINKKISELEKTSMYKEEKNKDFLINKLGLQNETNLIYKNAFDSLTLWTEKLNWNAGNDFILDSTIFINTAGNKCILVYFTLCQNNDNCMNEYMTFLYGTKISNKWYFFRGASSPTSRIHFGSTNSLTKDQFHILILQMLKNYLKKKAHAQSHGGSSHGGEWEINDAFFDDLTSNAYGGPHTPAQWDSVYLKISNPWQYGKAK